MKNCDLLEQPEWLNGTVLAANHFWPGSGRPKHFLNFRTLIFR